MNPKQNFIKRILGRIKNRIKDFGPVKYNREEYLKQNPVLGPKAPPTINVLDRDVKIREATIQNELRPILFGEVSNRSPEQQEYEARVITNTAINRVPQYKGHGDLNFAGVLTAKNQYQAYKGKEYNRYKSGDIRYTDQQKLKAIDKVIAELKAGTLKDNTNNSVFYEHTPDREIVITGGVLFP